jgi:hypothetical protein
MHFSRGLACVVLIPPILVSLASAQSDKNAAITVKVGIARITNQSARSLSPTRERDQLVQSLHSATKKSNVVIEAVPLEASSRNDAGEEAANKDCRYFVLTTVVDVRPSIQLGPGGIQAPAVAIGNAAPTRSLTITFTIFEVGEFRPLADGTTSIPDRDGNDLAVADEAMRTTALRVASEIRKDRPARID